MFLLHQLQLVHERLVLNAQEYAETNLIAKLRER